MSVYKTLVRPVLCYGSEAWTMHNRDKSRITVSEMRFMHHTAGYTKWDHTRNEDILHELHIEPVLFIYINIKKIGFNMYTACPEQDFVGQF